MIASGVASFSDRKPSRKPGGIADQRAALYEAETAIRLFVFERAALRWQRALRADVTNAEMADECERNSDNAEAWQAAIALRAIDTAKLAFTEEPASTPNAVKANATRRTQR